MSEEPNPRAPGVAAGIDEEMIARLVETFYGRVRADAELGPIFEAAVADWPAHLENLRDFWSSVVLMTGRFKGTPMRVHAELPGIGGEHFDHWLSLFRLTAEEVCPPPAAALFVDRAERIAKSLEMGIAMHRGKLPRLGERLVAGTPPGEGRP